MDIAEIGTRHLADALSGEMHYCKVTEWIDENGEPSRVYWKPVTGKQQIQIDEAGSEVRRTCMTVKVRALNDQGEQIFKKTPLVSLINDYDYDVIRTLCLIITGDIGYDMTTRLEQIEGE